MRTSVTPSETAFYFGSTYTAAKLAANNGFKGHALSRDGKPVKWSDDYATLLRSRGYSVERTVFVTVAHPHPEVAGETVNMWRTVETLPPL